jgi:hypothetical protein
VNTEAKILNKILESCINIMKKMPTEIYLEEFRASSTFEKSM